jgi:hypothetical protein
MKKKRLGRIKPKVKWLVPYFVHFNWSFFEISLTFTELTLEGDSGEEVALWMLTSICSSAKREVEVAL